MIIDINENKEVIREKQKRCLYGLNSCTEKTFFNQIIIFLLLS